MEIFKNLNIRQPLALTKTLLTVVVPTRNEADNVERLAAELEFALEGLDYRIIFVDDSSDSTPESIRQIMEQNPMVSLIHRHEAQRSGGLSTAVITGLDLARSEYVCVMDADLQHPPAKIREMLQVAQTSDADVVVASRYAPGGNYAGLSGPVRQLVSLATKTLAQIVFTEARKTSDPLTGFFLCRRSAIAGIRFHPTGFKVLLEILVCAPDARVVEVPFEFQARQGGVSKANLRQGLEYLRHLTSLFWYVPSAGRFWKFAMVGSSGVLVNLAVLATLVEVFRADKTLAWLLAVGVSILSNFLLNNAFTWRDQRNSGRIHFLVRGALAYPAAIIAMVANFAVYYPLVVEGFPYIPAAFLGILAATSVNFILNSKFIFRPAKPRYLNPDWSPAETAQAVLEELKAEWVALVRAPDAKVVADAGVVERSSLSSSEQEFVQLVLKTGSPTLLLTGPQRFPQARTNARSANSLCVPLFHNEELVGAIYAVSPDLSPFTEADLHWLTAFAAPGGSILS